MEQIETGQYEVIFRRKWDLEKGEKNTPKVPYRIWHANSTKGEDKCYHTLELYMEIRKDIPKYIDSGLAGFRFIGQFPMIKITNLIAKDATNDEIKNAQTVQQSTASKQFIRDLYLAVDGTTDFTTDDLKQHLIDKPVLITINVQPDTGYGIKYIMKKIELTKEPEIQPSALIDEVENISVDDDLDIYAF